MTSRSAAGESAVPPVIVRDIWFYRQVPAVVRRLPAHVELMVRSVTNGLIAWFVART